MDPSASGVENDHAALSPRAARAKLEEELGKLDITDEEATPLVVDDREDKVQPKWMVVGKPTELKFDRLSLWARVINLPFNLREKKWWMPIAQQIDKNVKEVLFDHAGGFLRARVSVDVANPLRRWILIDSARRQSVDMYEIEYEQLPHFCFSCGRLGHADLLCPTPGTRGPSGELPFGKGLRAADEWRKSSYSNGSMDDKGVSQNGKADTRSSSTSAEVSSDATSPLKRGNLNKRKPGTSVKVYRKVELPMLKDPADADIGAHNSLVVYDNSAPTDRGPGMDVGSVDRSAKRKKPTPTNSGNLAEAVLKPCPEQ
ncbi:hypothetical protein ACQ4PT_025562 [Festuca glaucescens]